MKQKKVLIITYYWPPGGGAGVQRWLKFVKYLPKYGWTPVVYTPSNGEMPVVDESLLKDVPAEATVIRKPIWEPYSLYKLFIGAGKNEKINTGFLTEKKRPGLAERISVWIRGNVFIPDARKFWISPSVKYLCRWLESNPVDVIVSSGPPHSMHLIAQQVAKRTKTPWLADFRDPWTNIDYYKDLKLSPRADRIHHQLERSVVTSASKVVVVGSDMQQEFQNKYSVQSSVILNGFDPDDFKSVQPNNHGKFVLSHVGSLVRSRNPFTLWKVLGDIVRQDDEFAQSLQIRLTGKVDVSVREAIEQNGLSDYLESVPYLQHSEVPSELASASVLLLLLNDAPNAKGILTGKLFEYMASGRPVLSIGPVDGDAARVVQDTGIGECVGFNDENSLKAVIAELFNKYKSGSLNLSYADTSAFTRQHQAGQLSQLLDEISAGNTAHQNKSVND